MEVVVGGLLLSWSFSRLLLLVVERVRFRDGRFLSFTTLERLPCSADGINTCGRRFECGVVACVFNLTAVRFDDEDDGMYGEDNDATDEEGTVTLGGMAVVNPLIYL